MACEPAFYQRFFSGTDRKRPIVNSISNFQTTINLRLNSVLSKLEATALSKVEYGCHVDSARTFSRRDNRWGGWALLR